MGWTESISGERDERWRGRSESDTRQRLRGRRYGESRKVVQPEKHNQGPEQIERSRISMLLMFTIHSIALQLSKATNTMPQHKP